VAKNRKGVVKRVSAQRFKAKGMKQKDNERAYEEVYIILYKVRLKKKNAQLLLI